MDSLYLLIPIALILVALGIKLLIWAIDSGQYDDLDKEAWRILAEEKPTEKPNTSFTFAKESTPPDSDRVAASTPGAGNPKDIN